MTKAVFLDRDGVLNRADARDGKPHPPDSLAELEILPGAAEACAALKKAGWLLVCVTNQPDIARGTADAAEVEAINRAVADACGLDELLVCPHDGAEGCDCRKPKPGLLMQAAAKHAIDLAASVMVGDRWRDVEAGQAAGCRTVFVDWEWRERRPAGYTFRCRSLAEAAAWIMGTTGS